MAKPRGRGFQPGNKTGRGRPAAAAIKSTTAAQELFGDNLLNSVSAIRMPLRSPFLSDTLSMRLSAPVLGPVGFQILRVSMRSNAATKRS